MSNPSSKKVVDESLKMYDILKQLVSWNDTILQEDTGAGDEMDLVLEGENSRSTAGRITARNIWNRPGSATGEEALELLRQKHVEKKREAEEAAARAEAKKAKQRDKVVALCAKGAAALKELKVLGAALLPRLKKDDLLGLLQASNPQGKEPKGNMGELLSKVRELPSVIQAIAYAQASTQPPVLTPSATQLPPMP